MSVPEETPAIGEQHWLFMYSDSWVGGHQNGTVFSFLFFLFFFLVRPTAIMLASDMHLIPSTY